MSVYSVDHLSNAEAQRLERAYGMPKPLVRFNPGGCMLPPHHDRIQQLVFEARVRDDDVWLLSYPRTGSTWCQEMVWLLGNDLDYHTASTTMQQLRAPLLESSTILFEYQDLLGDVVTNSVDYIDRMPSPRYIKSHLPLCLLPTELDKIKPKIIYTCRNPKDMCVSFYFHACNVHNLDVPFEEFADMLMEGLAPVGLVLDHYLAMWHKRHEPNVLFLMYEEMIADLRGTLKRIARFLEKEYTEEQYDELCDFLSFGRMRENRGCNIESLVESKLGKDFFKRTGKHFIRKGIVGDWKNHMSPELSQRFDDWIEKKTKGTGLKFD